MAPNRWRRYEKTMNCRAFPLLALPLALTLAVTAVPALASPGYADLAELTLAAPVIVRARIIDVERISAKQAPGLAADRARLLVTAAVDAALVAPGATPARLQWLWDATLDPRGKPPKPKGLIVLAWLTAPASDGKTQLLSRQAQQPHDTALESRIRAIAAEARGGGVPVITGVANGFRADGSVPGESESQFFLTAADGKGVTLVVTARPGEVRRVTVASGDVIDESATPVRRDTLLWYRLACFLPATLPVAAGGKDKALAADWQAALASLGPCGRGGQ
ncbi:MAG: hypothetical protein RL490_815 [Pseudomonadota bacterium]|jgi:hypothetical protein